MIVSVTDSGMGNRIKSLLSVMRMTSEYRVYWPKNRFGYSSFSDLFQNNIEVKKIPFFKNVFVGHGRLIVSPEIRFSPYFKIFKSDEIDYGFAPALYDQKKGQAAEIDSGKSIDFQFSRIPKSVQDKYIEKVKELVPIDYIQQAVSEFVKKSMNEKTVAVQIRTWKDENRRQLMFNKEAYFTQLDKLGDNNFFVSADDQEIIDEILLRYPGRACYYPKRISSYEPGSPDSQSVEFQQDCLIDMLLLGEASLIIGSHLSSFVEVAWWLALCKPDVIIVSPNFG